MPFLRRRGIMASESDMRRHTVIDHDSQSKQPVPRPDSTPDLPTGLGSVPELGPAMPVPAPPATPPSDTRSSFSSLATTPTVSTPANNRPASPPIQEESTRHVRFSMLRFRNASDSQLAAKARQYAAAEKPPPLPRRMSQTTRSSLFRKKKEK